MNHCPRIMHDLLVLPCLSGLKEGELAFMEQMARLKRITKNNILFEETEPVKFFFVVKQGMVKLYKTSKEGRELIVKVMGPREYFCCAPLYTGSSYFVGAVALEDTLLITIPAEEFKKALKNEVTATGWKIISGLCSKIRHLSSLVEDLTFKDVEERVINTLVRLADERAPGSKTASLQLTHQDIASMTGTVREVVSRTMSRLKKEGIIIDSSVKGFTINKEGLVRLLQRRVSVM